MMGDGQQTIRNQIIGGFVWFSRRFYDSNSEKYEPTAVLCGTITRNLGRVIR